MTILLTGASGFIGGQLINRLRAEGYVLRIAGRRDPGNGCQFFAWDGMKADFPGAAVEGADAVVHMAGEPVAQRWSSEVKLRIRDSRVIGTKGLVRAIRQASSPPRVLIAASAIGYYGDRGEEILREDSSPGTGFLPETCVEWEKVSQEASSAGLRVVLLRIGIVLHKSGGALKQMLPAFRLGAGGPIGSGQQWMSWIHRDDLVEMIAWSLTNETVRGPINGVAPAPARNSEFSRALGRVLHRPAVLPAPAFALKVLFGEMAGVVLSSQRVVPTVAVSAGFQFRYAGLEEALRAAAFDHQS
jgi:uncharacterized protein